MADKNFRDGSVTLPSQGVTREQLMSYMHHLQHEVGTMARAMEELTTTGVLKITSIASGSKAVNTADVSLFGEAILAQTNEAAWRSLLEGAQTMNAGGAVDVGTACTVLDAGPGTYEITLGVGLYKGMKKVIVAQASLGVWTLTGTFAGFTSLTFGDTAEGKGYSAELRWDGLAWHWIGGNATME